MNFYKHRAGLVFKALLTVIVGGMLLAAPQTAAKGFAYGTQLCLRSVIPALFPFFVVCNLLVTNPAACLLGLPLRPLARLLGLQGEQAPVILALSWVGGYAVCARLVARERQAGQLSATQAERLLLIGCCSGPGFVVGCLGGLLLGSVQLGVLLYGLQLAANFLAAACLFPFLRECGEHPVVVTPPSNVRSGGLSAAISDAVESTLQVCGCTLFFCILAELLRPFLPLWAPAWPLLSAGLEISTGSAAFASLGGVWALYGLCLCLSWPGLSVFCQIATLLGGAVPMQRLLLSRLLHGFFLHLLMRLCAKALPGVSAVFSSLSARVIPMNRLAPDAAMICFCFLCCALYKLRQTFYNKRRMVQHAKALDGSKKA